VPARSANPAGTAVPVDLSYLVYHIFMHLARGILQQAEKSAVPSGRERFRGYSRKISKYLLQFSGK
jgi:hypothetical protein